MAKNKEYRSEIENRRARHDYEILETYEAGMALKGTEVKSIRIGRANLQDSYARITDGEIEIVNLHISPYDQGNQFNHEPRRPRKLLLHKREIMRLFGLTREKGLTLVPLKIYFKNGLAKVLIGLAKGKKSYDKKDAIAERDAKRDMEQQFRERQKMWELGFRRKY